MKVENLPSGMSVQKMTQQQLILLLQILLPKGTALKLKQGDTHAVR
jgi:hypothetical protein